MKKTILGAIAIAFALVSCIETTSSTPTTTITTEAVTSPVDTVVVENPIYFEAEITVGVENVKVEQWLVEASTQEEAVKALNDYFAASRKVYGIKSVKASTIDLVLNK